MKRGDPALIRDWKKWLEHVEPYPDDTYAIDLETTGLSPWNDRLTVIGLYHEPTHTAGILHFPRIFTKRGERLPQELLDWVQDSRRRFIGFNLVGFDWYFLSEEGIDIFAGQKWTDAMIAEGCTIKSSRRDVRVSLASAYKRQLGKDLKKEIDHRTWQLPDLTDEQLAYVSADIQYLPALNAAQLEKISEDARGNANTVEQELALMTARMTINGFPVRMKEPVREHRFDNGATNEPFPTYIEKCKEWAMEVQEELRAQYVRPDLNVGSWQQVQWMFLESGLTYRTKTDEASLVRLRDGHDKEDVRHLAERILFVRGVAQRAKMYKPEWFQKFVHEVDGVHVIRPRYWQVGTETGRYSSSEPNIQQVAGDCRTFFGQAPGTVLLTADYSQLEVRIQAWLCKDEALLEACDSEDMHSAVAAAIFQIPISDVTGPQRKLAKAGTFTFLFGGGAQLLYEEAQTQGAPMTLGDAKEFEAAFFGRFQGLARRKSQMIRLAQTRQSVTLTMPHGLMRQIFGSNMKPTTLMNTEVQGGAASGLKMALVKMHRIGLGPFTQATIHDEIVVRAPREMMGDWTDPRGTVFNEIAAATKYCMEQGMLDAFPGTINGKPFPVKVEGHIDEWWKGRPPYTKEELLLKAQRAPARIDRTAFNPKVNE